MGSEFGRKICPHFAGAPSRNCSFDEIVHSGRRGRVNPAVRTPARRPRAAWPRSPGRRHASRGLAMCGAPSAGRDRELVPAADRAEKCDYAGSIRAIITTGSKLALRNFSALDRLEPKVPSAFTDRRWSGGQCFRRRSNGASFASCGDARNAMKSRISRYRL